VLLLRLTTRVEAQLRRPRSTIVVTALLTSALEESIGLAQTRKDLGVGSNCSLIVHSDPSRSRGRVPSHQDGSMSRV
jgi:hypothetical protein